MIKVELRNEEVGKSKEQAPGPLRLIVFSHALNTTAVFPGYVPTESHMNERSCPGFVVTCLGIVRTLAIKFSPDEDRKSQEDIQSLFFDPQTSKPRGYSPLGVST